MHSLDAAANSISLVTPIRVEAKPTNRPQDEREGCSWSNNLALPDDCNVLPAWVAEGVTIRAISNCVRGVGLANLCRVWVMPRTAFA